MPDTAGQEYRKLIQDRAQAPFPVPPQRNIEILPQPGRQRDMPSVPEFRDRTGSIGVLKVLPEMKSEHSAHPDRHIGISAEIKIDLHQIGKSRQPGRGHIDLRGRSAEQGICDQAAGIRDQNLLGQAADQPPDSCSRLLPGNAPAQDLTLDIPVLHDRSRDQLREE